MKLLKQISHQKFFQITFLLGCLLFPGPVRAAAPHRPVKQEEIVLLQEWRGQFQKGFVKDLQPRPDNVWIQRIIGLSGGLLLAAALAALVLVLYNKQLRAAVQARTPELQQKNEELAREIEASKQARQSGKMPPTQWLSPARRGSLLRPIQPT